MFQCCKDIHVCLSIPSLTVSTSSEVQQFSRLQDECHQISENYSCRFRSRRRGSSSCLSHPTNIFCSTLIGATSILSTPHPHDQGNTVRDLKLGHSPFPRAFMGAGRYICQGVILLAQTDGDPIEAGVGVILPGLQGYSMLQGSGTKPGEVNPVGNVVLVHSQHTRKKYGCEHLANTQPLSASFSI